MDGTKVPLARCLRSAILIEKNENHLFGGTMRVNSVFAAVLLCALAATVSGQELRKAISKPTPRYPEIARKMNLVGSVKVEIEIGADGKVRVTNVVGGHPILVDSVITTLKEWKYEPAKEETTATLTFEFRP